MGQENNQNKYKKYENELKQSSDNVIPKLPKILNSIVLSIQFDLSTKSWSLTAICHIIQVITFADERRWCFYVCLFVCVCPLNYLNYSKSYEWIPMKFLWRS